jgi:GT2 family glycosyltransferase
VPTTHDPARLLACLESIGPGAGAVPHEVVVVLNGADDDVVEAARSRTGVELVESRWNIGFAAACNLGRASARGELIVLLHDDAEPQEGWLAALVESAERHPEAGVIGSRVLGDDGVKLQTAGAVMFADARSALLGRGGRPDAAEHMAGRPVDYCTSASLLVRADLWDEVGGLDELLFPAGYVDADLAMAAWATGRAVLYEPSSVVHHQHGGTMPDGFKVFVHHRNRERFRRRWATELEAHEPHPAGEAELEAACERALARAAARADAIGKGAGPARGALPTATRVAPVADDLGPRLARLELRLRRDYIAIAEPELERVHREYAKERELRLRTEAELARTRAEVERLRENERTLDAILAGGWWRLRGRVLPLLRVARRVRARLTRSGQGRA